MKTALLAKTPDPQGPSRKVEEQKKRNRAKAKPPAGDGAWALTRKHSPRTPPPPHADFGIAAYDEFVPSGPRVPDTHGLAAGDAGPLVFFLPFSWGRSGPQPADA